MLTLRRVDRYVGKDRDCVTLSVEELRFYERLVATCLSMLSNIAENCNVQRRREHLMIRTALCDSALLVRVSALPFPHPNFSGTAPDFVS
jgi:hypothetical protein